MATDDTEPISEDVLRAAEEIMDDLVKDTLEKSAEVVRVGKIDPERYEMTDEGNVLLLKDMFGWRMRWIRDLNRWAVFYPDRGWNLDADAEAENLYMKMVEKRAEPLGKILEKEKEIRETIKGVKWEDVDYETKAELRSLKEKVKELRSFVKKCQDEPRTRRCLNRATQKDYFAVDAKEFDLDPLLIGCGNKVIRIVPEEDKVDVLDHDPGLYVSKHLGVCYDPDAKCKRFRQFLDEVFEGNKKIMRYALDGFAYSLTGLTKEKNVFIGFGPSGNNGKTQLLNVKYKLLGDYAITTGFEAFEKNKFSDSKNEDMVDFLGKRILIIDELGDGGVVDEHKIKKVSGNTTIRCRRNYAKYWMEFKPVFKIWIGCNEAPRIKGTNPAIWNRVKLLPFNVEFFEEKEPRMDKDLEKKLENELPGILNVLLKRIPRVINTGLCEPEEVAEVTNEYRSEEDQWLEWRLDNQIDDDVEPKKASELLTECVEWSEQHKTAKPNHTTMGRYLRNLGLIRCPRKEGVFWHGKNFKCGQSKCDGRRKRMANLTSKSPKLNSK